MRFFGAGLALCITALGIQAATITLGNNPQPNENNILLNTGTSGTTVTGTLNTFPNVLVNFTSNQALTEPASGQARIQAQNGSALTSLSVSLANGLTYGDLIFNPAIVGNLGSGGTGTVNVITTAGTSAPFSFTVGPGQNYVTVLAGPGEGIISTTVSVPGGFASFQQPRISGPFNVAVPQGGGGGTQGGFVPEPATFALMGGGLAGIALLRRKTA